MFGRIRSAPRGSISMTFLPSIVSVRIANRLSAPMVLPPSELHQDAVAVDRHVLHVADVQSDDAHLVALVDTTGVSKLRIVAWFGEKHWQTSDALAHRDNEAAMAMASIPTADLFPRFCFSLLCAPTGRLLQHFDRTDGSAGLQTIDLEGDIAEVEVEEVAVDTSGSADNLQRLRHCPPDPRHGLACRQGVPEYSKCPTLL